MQLPKKLYVRLGPEAATSDAWETVLIERGAGNRMSILDVDKVRKVVVKRCADALPIYQYTFAADNSLIFSVVLDLVAAVKESDFSVSETVLVCCRLFYVG